MVGVFFFLAVAELTSLTAAASASQPLEMCYRVVTAFHNLAAFLPPLGAERSRGAGLGAALR